MEKRKSRKSNCSLPKVKGVYRKDRTRLLSAMHSERTRGIDTNCSKRPSSWIHKEKNKKKNQNHSEGD